MSYLSTGNPRDDDRMVGDRRGFQEDVGGHRVYPRDAWCFSQ